MKNILHLFFTNHISFNLVVESFGNFNSTRVLNDEYKPSTNNIWLLIYSWHTRWARSATGANNLCFRPEQRVTHVTPPSLSCFQLNVVTPQIHPSPVRLLSRLTNLNEGDGRFCHSDNISRRPSAMLDASHSFRLVKRSTLDGGAPEYPDATLGCLQQVDSLGRVNPTWCIINQSWDWCDDASHASREIGTALFAIGGKLHFTMHGCIEPDHHDLPGRDHLVWARCECILKRMCLAMSSECGEVAYVH